MEDRILEELRPDFVDGLTLLGGEPGEAEHRLLPWWFGSIVPQEKGKVKEKDSGVPRYIAREEQQPPKVVNGKLEQVPPITNYNFISTDGLWKINLTQHGGRPGLRRYAGRGSPCPSQKSLRPE